jgi:glycosyltransferase involved in cell wall biosynthesis
VRLLVVSEQRFLESGDRRVRTRSAFSYGFWSRYLETFDQVTVAARVSADGGDSSSIAAANGDRVHFCRLPGYVGPLAFLGSLPRLRRRLAAAFHVGDAVIVRAFSPISLQLLPRLRRCSYPYGVELVSDPHDAFAPRAVRHPFRSLFRAWFSRSLRRQCQEACAVAYVTQERLQRRYPSRETSFSTHYSSIDLQEGHFAHTPRPPAVPRTNATLLFVGSLAQMYKGPDVLLSALADCRRRGLDIALTLVGDGRHRAELERLAARLGVSSHTRFEGEIPAGDAVRRALDGADLFVLPSRSEGLPRAMVEAMARGVPCIGTTVGGIPELLDAEDLVPPDDANSLSRKIGEVLTDPPRLARMSARNLLRSRSFAEAEIQPRRKSFYEEVARRTESWLERSGRDPDRRQA